jgi:putative transposase
MRWLTLTHTQRWHAHRRSAGAGHLDQGSFKSFPVQDDGHLVTVCRYVERNPVRAALVARAERWRWSRLWRWGTATGRPSALPTLSDWPIERPSDWARRVNAALSPVEEEAMRRSLARGQPLGNSEWQALTAARLGLESTFRPRGRPKKLPEIGS